jgi:dTDP-4-dehydrorhamnose reductase
MRIAVTGRIGQVVTALLERGPMRGVTVVALGRPELDLALPTTVAPALRVAQPDIIVNAAAYTAVDQAESEEALALSINGAGAGEVAKQAAALGVPLIHISTDYVFDGSLERPYRETDPVAPLGAYGRSKLAGEAAVVAAGGDHAILRTAWVYSPFGRNFVRTMLRLGAERSEVGVVADQVGSPTSAIDAADAILSIAQNLHRSAEPALRGIFHMTGSGEASWADVAEAVFEEASRAGRRPVAVRRIATADYPTPARRPANSRLDGGRLAENHGVRLPHWRGAVSTCVARLLSGGP